jgi:hypothetical protein
MTRETETERQARYAARNVTDKLGVKPGQRLRVVGTGNPDLLARVRARLGRRIANQETIADIVLYWPRSAEEITTTLAALKQQIEPAGGIWVFSAKRGHERFSRAPYLPDSVLIPSGLAAGLVDNKVCSISEHDSAMRFVIRRADRAQRKTP